MGMTHEQRMNYCKDCIRSIYHDNDCDINREDNGYYNNAGDKCYCKVTKEGRTDRKISMGKQIDANKLIEHFIDKTPNGWLVPICENESRWTLEGIISEIEYFVSTVEAIPKDQYEARLKADMVAMLTEIQLEIEDKEKYYEAEFQEPSNQVHEAAMCGRMLGYGGAKQIIQEKINALKGE